MHICVSFSKTHVHVNIRHALQLQVYKPRFFEYATFNYHGIIQLTYQMYICVIFSQSSHWKRHFPSSFFWLWQSDSWLNHQSLCENLSPIRRDGDLFHCLWSHSNLYICIHICIKINTINSFATAQVTWICTMEIWTKFCELSFFREYLCF